MGLRDGSSCDWWRWINKNKTKRGDCLPLAAVQRAQLPLSLSAHSFYLKKLPVKSTHDIRSASSGKRPFCNAATSTVTFLSLISASHPRVGSRNEKLERREGGMHKLKKKLSSPRTKTGTLYQLFWEECLKWWSCSLPKIAPCHPRTRKEKEKTTTRTPIKTEEMVIFPLLRYWQSLRHCDWILGQSAVRERGIAPQIFHPP